MLWLATDIIPLSIGCSPSLDPSVLARPRGTLPLNQPSPEEVQTYRADAGPAVVKGAFTTPSDMNAPFTTPPT
jgi:hypothetical protein